MRKSSASFRIVFALALCSILFMACEDASDTSPAGGGAGPTDSQGRPVPATVTNDADLLVFRCGKPDVDDSTQNDNPRPAIVTRSIEYRKSRLRVLFVPGGDAKPGDPPPYKWKLFGIVDTRTKRPMRIDAAVKRLPCWTGNAR